jgi:hypothetical protein
VIIGVVALAAGAFLIVRAPWIAAKGRESRLSETWFVRLAWNFSTNVWWVRYLGLAFVVLGVWLIATA